MIPTSRSSLNIRTVIGSVPGRPQCRLYLLWANHARVRVKVTCLSSSAPSCCSYHVVRHILQLSSGRDATGRRVFGNSLVPNSFTYDRRTPHERSVLFHIRRSACPYHLDVFHPPSQVPILQLTSTAESPVRLTLQRPRTTSHLISQLFSPTSVLYSLPAWQPSSHDDLSLLPLRRQLWSVQQSTCRAPRLYGSTQCTKSLPRLCHSLVLWSSPRA
jgi:hypothetical protein